MQNELMSHPAGFFSYVRFNDETEEGRLSELRQKLQAEVSMLLGETFELFQDTKGVAMGQNWQKRLEEGLAESTVFIPILTPGYLKRDACRAELAKFLEKEKEVGRDDLVLPLMYLQTPAITDEARRSQDPLAIALHAHQYRDWSDLRFEPWDKSKFMRLSLIANEIVKTLERKSKAAAPTKTKHRTSRSVIPSTDTGSEIQSTAPSQETISTPEAQQTRAKNRRLEPATLVVDPMPGRGEFTSIGAAIAAANGGERILVRPHVYTEAITLDKPIELIGDGKREEIVIEAANANAIAFQASFGRVANFTIRQLAGGKWYGVNIGQGQLVLEDCDITSQSISCVGIYGGANPILRRNVIRNAVECGVMLYDAGRGTLEDNDIFENKFAGIQISGGSNPVLRRNRIHDGRHLGIFVYEAGKGTFEDNDIFANELGGIHISSLADPVSRRNRIHDERGPGILVTEKGKGTFEDNDIFANALAGVHISTKGDPAFRRNRIHDGKQGGVFVYEGGKGTFEDNEIFGNTLAGVEIATEAEPLLRRNQIREGKQNGVLVHKGGKGVLEENEIVGNAFAGIEIREGGSPTLRKNRINKNTRSAVWVHDNGGGNFQQNDLRNNKEAWKIEGDETQIIRENNLES